MSLPTARRAFLSACLTLGSLLCVLPALADAPAVPAAPSAQAKALALQNVVPGDLLKAMHWDPAAQKFDSAAPIRVEGVTQISPLPATNSLSIVATPNGFNKVRDLIRVLDVAPRQVQIKAALARATAADLKASGIYLDVVPIPDPGHPLGSEMGYAAGDGVAQLLQTLRTQGTILQSPTVITTNNVDAALNVSGQPMPTLPNVQSFTFAVTPRVNSDNTLTLALHPKMSWRVSGRTSPRGLRGRNLSLNLQTLRTIRSGDSLVLTNIFAGAAGVDGGQLLLFVTPTILPTGGGTAAVK